MKATGLILLAVAAAALAIGCNQPLSNSGYSPPDPVLSGAWGTTSSSGSFVEFVMQAAGGTITGQGREFRAGAWFDTLQITGQYDEQTGSLVLTFQYSDSGASASYKGLALTPTQLAGTWASVSDSDQQFDRNFFVRPQAPCADSAPLLGTPNATAPGYLVAFTSAVADPAAGAARLGTLFDFTPTTIYATGTPTGFAADILPSTAARVRCDSTVAFMEYAGAVLQ
jgi:hypothetical protein